MIISSSLSHSLDDLANKEKNLIDNLARLSLLISIEERKEEQLDIDIEEVNKQLRNEKTPFEIILENQIVEAEKELLYIQYKLKKQQKLSAALNELYETLHHSQIQHPNIHHQKKKIIEKSKNKEKILTTEIKKIINENIKTKENVHSLMMKRNIQESEMMRMSDYISIYKQRKKDRLSQMKQNQNKQRSNYATDEKLILLIQNIKTKKRSIFHKYKILNKQLNLTNLFSIIKSNDLLEFKSKEYEIRTEQSIEFIELVKNMNSKIHNELEKQNFNLFSWLLFLNQSFLDYFDMKISTFNSLLE